MVLSFLANYDAAFEFGRGLGCANVNGGIDFKLRTNGSNLGRSVVDVVGLWSRAGNRIVPQKLRVG
jgi:hypothetical protein